MANEKQEKQNKPPRFQYFCMMLYPDCEHHLGLLRMFERRPQLYHPVYILHDKDVYMQDDYDKWKNDPKHPEHLEQEPNWKLGEPKKPHYHVMIKWRLQRDASSMASFLGLDYVEGVTDWCSMLSYFIHDTHDSWHKFQYPLEAVHGDSKIIAYLSTQNPHFVQLAQYANMARMGMSLPDMVDHVLESPDSKIMIEAFDKYNHFIVAMRNDLKTTPKPYSVVNGIDRPVEYLRNYGDYTNFCEV